MAYLLFECLSEEMPAQMQHYVESRINEILQSKLEKNNLNYDEMKIYTSPQRVVIFINGLPIDQGGRIVELRGPGVNSSESAIEGFLRKVGKKKGELKIKSIGKREFYFLSYSEESNSVQTILHKILEDLLSNFNWPKSMKWSNKTVKWIRPIKNLLCLFNGNIVPVEFAGIQASNFTYGHKFRSNGKLLISHYSDYFTKLREHYVIFDQNERLKLIKEGALEVAQKHGLNIKFDEGLLKEINGLVEYPTVLIGKIENNFMSLPKELLITVMKNHQKYHHLLDENDQLAPFFIVVSNNGNNENVIEGNEKVLKARLSDAQFLIECDLQHDLAYYFGKLSEVTFYSKLGSMKEKVDRVLTLSKYISLWVPNASFATVEGSANVVKADLATRIVKEFPELQGVIGSYYAQCEGMGDDIVLAIKEHYYPLNGNSKCTTNPTAITLSIADKIDTLVGIISVGEKISGSRDPFALRQLATGLIRTILENQIMLPVNLIIEKSTNLYPEILFKKKKILRIKKSEQDDKLYRAIVVQNVKTFLDNRLKAILSSKGVTEDIFNSVVATKKNHVIEVIYRHANYLNSILHGEDGNGLLVVYKRVKNILSHAEEVRKAKIRKNYNSIFFVDKLEIDISIQLMKLTAKIKEAVKKNDIESALSLLKMLLTPTNNFIDQVLINHENRALRNNRLRILSYVRYLFNMVVNFDALINVQS